MTLLAAFKISGVPVLIGDFLLTDISPGSKHIFLPTKPELPQVTPQVGRRRVCGLRKKIYKISDRLVVGFAGSLAPGTYLMKRLRERFGNSSLTLDDLKSLLATESFPGKKETELIGWIWEQRPLCFHWKGVNPQEVKLVDSVFTGSGGTHFRDDVMRADVLGGSPELRTAVDKAIYVGTCQVGKVLLQELSEAKNIEHDYGFGAELIVWDGAKFFYVEKVAFAFWNIVVGQNNELLINPSNVSALYRNFDAYSVMQVSHIGPKEGQGVGLEAKDTYVQVITPIYDDMPLFDARTVARQSFDSTLWFSGIMVVNPTKSINATCSVVSECRDDIASFTRFRDGVLSLDVGQLRDLLPREIFN